MADLVRRTKASPAVGSDGTIYVTGVENIDYGLPKKGYVYAVSATGVLVWESKIEGAAVSAPTIGNDGIIYVGTCDPYGNGHLCAIERGGNVRWKVETGDVAMSSPAIGADGTIYVGSFGHIDFPKGATPSPETLSRAFYKGLKVEFDVYAIQSSGKLKWKFKTVGGWTSLLQLAPTGQSMRPT